MVSTNCSGALAATAGATLVAVELLVLIMLVVDVKPASATFRAQSGKIPYSGWDATSRSTRSTSAGEVSSNSHLCLIV
jgi:hypothetical protein